jgi:glycosyltransferase involved in cell wall biosynthesis
VSAPGAAQLCFASPAGRHGWVTSCRNAAAVFGARWVAFTPDDLLVELFESELLVLSGWDETYEPLLEARQQPTVPRWHSPALKSELSQEGRRVARILELLDAGRLAAVAVSDLDLVEAFGRERVVFVPELLDPREYEGVTPLRHDGTNVSLFGGAHHRKNLFVQLAAFELTRRSLGGTDWTLHLNGQSIADADVRSFLEALRVRFVDHGFLERPDYLSLLAGMDAGLSAALSESYCYVAADHMALGVPVVTSGAVRCADAGPLRVENPWSLDEVAERLRLALERPELARAAAARLLARASENAEHARAALAQLRSLAGVPA